MGTTPSARAARRAERKRRREEERRLASVRRSRVTTAVLAAVALVVSIWLYAVGQATAALIAWIVGSAFVGLSLGATIRLHRERANSGGQAR